MRKMSEQGVYLGQGGKIQCKPESAVQKKFCPNGGCALDKGVPWTRGEGTLDETLQGNQFRPLGMLNYFKKNALTLLAAMVAIGQSNHLWAIGFAFAVYWRH